MFGKVLNLLFCCSWFSAVAGQKNHGLWRWSLYWWLLSAISLCCFSGRCWWCGQLLLQSIWTVHTRTENESDYSPSGTCLQLSCVPLLAHWLILCLCLESIKVLNFAWWNTKFYSSLNWNGPISVIPLRLHGRNVGIMCVTVLYCNFS